MAVLNDLKGKSILWIFVILYPILPSYTRIGGYAAYSWLALLTLMILAILNIGKTRKIPRTFFRVASSIFMLYLIPFAIHGEFDRVVFEIIEVMIPLTLLCFALKYCNQHDIEKIISILIITSLILCVFGLIEFFTSFNFFSLIENMQYDNPRFGSVAATRLGLTRIEQSFNTALTYASYLSMVFTLTFYRFFKKKNKLYLIIMLLQAINIFLTMSRGITLVFIAGTCALLWFNRKYIGIKRIFSIIIFVFLCLSIIMFSFPEILDSINKMLGSAFNLIIGGKSDIDESSILRQNFQARAFESLKEIDVFIFGVGEYGLRSLISIDNEWLLELTGYGIVGFTGFMILMAIPFIYAIKGVRRSKLANNQDAKFFYMCMLILLVEYALSLYTVAQMAEARLFYIIFAIICLSSISCRKEKENNHGVYYYS